MNKRPAARLTLACVIVCLVTALAGGTRASRVASPPNAAPVPSLAPATATLAAPVAVPAQTFNLADYGAVGDGVTDNGPALQAALDAVVAAGGGTLRVPAGRFAIVTPVTIVAHGIPLEVRGVESSTQPSSPFGGGDALSRGLDLTSEFLPRTGSKEALTFGELSRFLIQDIAFVGTPGASTDARITLSIFNIDDAVVRHCEFYGLISLEPGGSIIQNWGCHFTLRQSVFLGCTANSGLYTPVVQNMVWQSINVEDVIFIDYGQRAELYGKMGYGAPLTWINVGTAAPPTADSPRREAVLRRVFLDEGGWQGVTIQPARYQNPVVPIDLFYVTGLYVNVSNFWQTGHYISSVREVLVEDSLYTWSDRADSAIHVHDAKDAIIDRVRTEKAARRLHAGDLTSRLTVINSTYDELASQAAQTVVLNPALPDDDPVLYVRTRFQSALGREPDAAAHYYWSRRLLDCGANAACVTSQRAALADHLAANPAPTFVLAGRAIDDTGQAVPGVPVTLSGSQSVTTTTGADGSYRFARLPTSGSYTVTVGARPQYTFPVPARTVTLPAGDQTLDFNALVARYAIGGRLTDERGRAVQGATLTLSGGHAGTATTDSNGNYTLANVAYGRDYTVTASSARHTFAAPSQSFTNLDGNRTANFVGTSLFHTIAGRVLDSANNPVAGLALALTGSKTGSATTDAQGNFLFTDLPRGGSYTITPAKLVGYTYSPAARSFGNLTADSSTTIVAVPTNFKLSGRVVSGGAGLSGVTMTLSGSKSGTATTDANGAYSFSVPLHGDFAVAPSKAHYTFDRANSTFTAVNADQTAADFVATVNRHRIGGSVKRPNGAAMAGVAVTLSGGQAGTATTDSNGAYSFANLPAGAAYTVAASRPGYDFAPASRSLANLGADQTADFTVTPASVALAGRVTAGGAALAGVAVTLSGSQAGAATTDSNGNYSFTVTAEGSYTLTAALKHYTFATPSQSVSNPTSAQTFNFAATLNRHNIAGRVVDKNNAGLGGVSVALTGAATANATTDAQGNFSLTNLPAGGNYAVTASKANYTFAPAGVPVADLGSDQTVNFTGTLLDYALRGRVTSGGAGLAGVAVTLSGSKSGAATTDAQGNYAFTVPAEGSYALTAALKHYTFAPPSASFANLAGDRTADFAATLNRHAVSGRVADKNNAGVQGATVTLSGSQSGTATTDAQGNYSFPDLPAGGSYTLTAALKYYTFGPAGVSINDLGADSTANNFTGTLLDYTLAGRITSGGSPLAGATVTLSGSQAGTATTDAQGNYSFPQLPAGGNYTLTAARANYTFAPASVAVSGLGADSTSNNFTGTLLDYTLSGRVTSGGSPLAGATVTLSGGQAGTATTDTNGAYSFTVPGEGGYTLTASKKHYTFAQPSQTFDNLSSARTADFGATLNRHAVSGRVADKNNAGVQSATVTLAGAQEATATTDAQGNYSFANLPAGGNYTLTAARANYTFGPASVSVNDLGADSTANFTGTLADYKLSGRVTSGDAPLPGVTVTLAGAREATATTDTNGNYSFTVPAEGSYALTAALKHYTFAPPSASFANLAGDRTADFAATLNRHAVSGRVADKNNAGVQGVTVTLSGSQSGTATTDAQGNYSFPDLPAGGSYTLTAALKYYTFAPASVAVNDLGADSTANNFTGTLLDYTLAGRVTAGGAPLAGATVTLSGSQAGTATTDAQGNYSFPQLPAGGSYTLTAALKHYTFEPASASFEGLGGNQTADFAATLNRHAISGRVADANDAGVSGVTLTLAGAQEATATTDAQGNFSFASLPAGGDYTVTPALANHAFTPASRSFEDLSANASATFAADVVSRLISGRVTEKGAPLAGVEVTLAGGQAGKMTTAADGSYTFTVPAGGDYTVTPSKKNYGFSPAAASFKGLASDGVADFAATLHAVVGFAESSYTVAEGGASVVVTVTREGDTSAQTSVVYEGVGNTAKRGSDFVASVGLLTFSPGEVSETFTLFITDDAFVEGAEQFTLTLTPSGGAVAGAAATVTINDNDTAVSQSNPVDDDEFFVREHYRDFFSREPDAAGLKFWTDEIRKCGADAGCREARRVSVSAAFFLSIEFQQTGYFVHRLYRATYGRVPTRVGEFMLDSRVVGDGVVVGGQGWEARLAQNKREFLEQWTRRPEFERLYGGGFTDWWFVQTLYQNMNVALTDARREALLAKLAAGATRAEVLAEVIEEEQFNKQEFNRAFVLMQYFGYLRRDPDEAPDADLSGFNFWLSKLNEFGGDYEKAEMVKAFLSSAEYRGRFGN